MAQDILMDINNNLVFNDGDFVVNTSDDMHIQHILTALPGQYYQSPLVGVGIRDLQNAPFDRVNIVRTIREQLQSDGFNIRQIQVNKAIDDLELDIDAILK